MTKARLCTLQDEYLQAVRELEGDLPSRRTGDGHLSESYAHDPKAPISWATNPYILDARQLSVLEHAASTMGSIMEKVMFKYHRDRSFRKLFGLPPAVEELTLVPSGCHAAVPLSRIDLFFDPTGRDYHICGIVTGGVDGMAASAEVTRAVSGTEAYRRFAASHTGLRSLDAVRACTLTLMHTYGKWANAEEGRNHPTHPSIAVVDVEGSRRHAETKTVVEVLRGMGCYARATDFSQLRVETVGGIRQLVDNHGPVTCVWLRATMDDALAAPRDGLNALVEATRRGLVCTIGGYRSWPCCTRSFFSVLRSKDCRALLSSEENAFVEAHVPEAHVIDASVDLSDFYDQQRWVIRTGDGHGYDSVIAGVDLSRAAWRNRLVKCIRRHDALQAYIEKQAMTVACVDEQGSPVERTVSTMLGLYAFEGRLGGIAVSCGTGATISDWNDRLEMGCVIVER